MHPKQPKKSALPFAIAREIIGRKRNQNVLIKNTTESMNSNGDLKITIEYFSYFVN